MLGLIPIADVTWRAFYIRFVPADVVVVPKCTVNQEFIDLFGEQGLVLVSYL
jgi:hypothetical protein